MPEEMNERSDKESGYNLGAVTNFLTRVAMMKTDYIYYGFEEDRFKYVELQTNSKNGLSFSDTDSDTHKSSKAKKEESHLLSQTVGFPTQTTIGMNSFTNSSRNVQSQRTLLDFDGMSAKKIEQLDFTVFIST